MSFFHLQTQHSCLSAHPSFLTSPSYLTPHLPACTNPGYSCCLQISWWEFLPPSVVFWGFEYKMLSRWIDSGCHHGSWQKVLELRFAGRSSSLGDDLWKLCVVLGSSISCFLAMWCELLFFSMPLPQWNKVPENTKKVTLPSYKLIFSGILMQWWSNSHNCNFPLPQNNYLFIIHEVEKPLQMFQELWK